MPMTFLVSTLSGSALYQGMGRFTYVREGVPVAGASVSATLGIIIITLYHAFNRLTSHTFQKIKVSAPGADAVVLDVQSYTRPLEENLWGKRKISAS